MPFWIVVAAVLGYTMPAAFSGLESYSVFMLGGVMLVMSLTLKVEVIGRVFARPKALIAGFLVKWLTAPILAVIAAHLAFSTQPELAAGTILDGAVPAGASSNLFAFLAHGAVELAVCLSFIHMLLAPVLTPIFATAFVGKYIAVSFSAMFVQLLEFVLLPVTVGLALRYLVGARRIEKVTPYLPMVSAILLYGVALGLFAAAGPTIRKNGAWIPVIALTTGSLTIINLTIGYVLARLLRIDRASARAIMFDAGVYNSGLGAVLANINFGPFAAIPPLMNAVVNLLIGSMLASFLQRRPIPATAPADPAVPDVSPTDSGLNDEPPPIAQPHPRERRMS
ncbi:bile acid:sodium symporter family protein [Burkholderia sp. WAC0059]|uniref:bile acid:sodium symporter family protein n=1 Tax=Burkholderia sp. WAC0059 TaxID=2066022 RepID=UPI00215582BC|nr:bile acid:sodium symporter family protein [Burkholderia sp. WAC0059]